MELKRLCKNLTRLKVLWAFCIRYLSCDQNILPFIRFIYKFAPYANDTEKDNRCCFNTLANSFSIVNKIYNKFATSRTVKAGERTCL